MIGLLSSLLSGIETIGSMALWAVETCFNNVAAAVVAAYNAVVAVLPSMSAAPLLGHPQWLDWLSWFYPVGDLLAGIGVVVSLWIAFLVFRYFLRLVRAM